MINNPDILISITKQELTDEVIAKLYSFLSLIIRNHEHYWGQYKIGAIDLLTFERYEGSLKAIFSFERTQNWWKNQTTIKDSEFKERVNMLINELPIRSEIVTEALRRIFGN